MKYYASYKPETGKTHIVAYDEAKRGAPGIVNDHTTFLYHNSIIVSRVYDMVADALLGSLGRYSSSPCRVAGWPPDDARPVLWDRPPRGRVRPMVRCEG